MKIEYDNSDELVLIKDEKEYSFSKKEEYKEIYAKEGNSFRLRTLFLYFISMFPFATLFTAVYYIIYLGHAYFIKLDEISKLDVKKEYKKEEEILLIEEK